MKSVQRLQTLNERILNDFLRSGQPFITSDVGGSLGTTFETVDDWAVSLSSSWPREETVQPWQSKFEEEIVDEVVRQEYSDFLRYNKTITLKNYGWVRKKFPKSYLSLIANNPAEISLVKSVFEPPKYFPAPNLRSMWMYAGSRGAGVTEHIDNIGCSCSWSYMVFGSKKWLFSSAPGDSSEIDYEVLQVSVSKGRV